MLTPLSIVGAPIAGLRTLRRRVTRRRRIVEQADTGSTFDLAAPGAEGMAVPERGRPGPAAIPQQPEGSGTG